MSGGLATAAAVVVGALAAGLGRAGAWAMRATFVAVFGLGLSACKEQARQTTVGQDAPPPATNLYVLDGLMSDWPDTARLAADGRYLYARFRAPDREQTLQSSPTPTTLRFDTDNDPATGRDGAELTVVFSPPRDDGSPGNGVSLTAYDGRGTPRPVSHAEAGFVFAPTYASDWYELRIARSEALGLADSSGVGFAVGREAWARLDTLPRSARAIAAGTDSFYYRGAREGGVVRVVSWNVEHTSPAKNPEPFARVLRAVAPDVVLVQEWVDTDTERLRAWFEQHVGGTWHAHKDEAWGVGIVSRYPLSPASKPLRLRGEEHPVRAARAYVETPTGRLLCVSAHLKCCGSAGSDEDSQRMAEASLINNWIRAHDDGVVGVVVAGDMNLVGTRTPLELLAADADLDGSALDVAETFRDGDAAAYTWRDADSRFTPGRLDWLLTSGSSLALLRAAVLDTTNLRGPGVEAGDTDASDHLPIVADVRTLPGAGRP